MEIKQDKIRNIINNFYNKNIRRLDLRDYASFSNYSLGLNNFLRRWKELKEYTKVVPIDADCEEYFYNDYNGDSGYARFFFQKEVAKMLKNNIPNTYIEFLSYLPPAGTISIPPVIYSVYKMIWAVAIAEYAKNTPDISRVLLENKLSFIPKYYISNYQNYFNTDNNKYRNLANDSIIFWCGLFSLYLASTYPELYAALKKEAVNYKDTIFGLKPEIHLSFKREYSITDSTTLHFEYNLNGAILLYSNAFSYIYKLLSNLEMSTKNILVSQGNIFEKLWKKHSEVSPEKCNFIKEGVKINMNNLMDFMKLYNAIQNKQKVMLTNLGFKVGDNSFNINIPENFETELVKMLKETENRLAQGLKEANSANTTTSTVNTTNSSTEEMYTFNGTTVKKVNINGSVGYQKLYNGIFIPCSKDVFNNVKSHAVAAQEQVHASISDTAAFPDMIAQLFENRTIDNVLGSGEGEETNADHSDEEPTADELNELDEWDDDDDEWNDEEDDEDEDENDEDEDDDEDEEEEEVTHAGGHFERRGNSLVYVRG